MKSKGGVVWSLFDGSGIMGLPWAQAGHQVYCFNASSADHGDYSIKMDHDNLIYVDQWIDESFSPDTPAPGIIFAFPSCTNMAGSGAKHERESVDVLAATSSARLVETLGNRHSCAWMVENPVGKLSTLWRKPDMYFDPFEFGGFLDASEGSFHRHMPAQDAYTKRTCLWFGNGFIQPEKNPVPHIGCFWGWKYLGGKSQLTKQLRSLTPRGFARAVFAANQP